MNTVTGSFTPEDVTANGISRGLYLHPTSKFQALSKKACLATSSNYWSRRVRQDLEARAIPLAPRPIWRVFPTTTRLMGPTEFGQSGGGLGVSLRVFLEDHNGCLSFPALSVACCFLLACASGHCLAGGWRHVVLVLAFIPKRVNALVSIVVSRLLPAFFLSCWCLSRE